MIFYLLFWQWLMGTYHYQLHYIYAALGDDAQQAGCDSLKVTKNPWKNLSAEEWYRLQGCLGNAHGYERQGALMRVVSIMEVLLTTPIVTD